jgi:hypothetical protein
MDVKLAKGFAREGFRRSMNEAGTRQDERMDMHAPFIQRLSRRGKLSKDEVQKALEGMIHENARLASVVFVEKFVNGSPKSLSRLMDALLVGANCWSGPFDINGYDEHALNYSLFFERYNTKSIEFRGLTRPIYVRQHAVSRFIERAETPFRSAAKSLWPGLLFIDALDYFDGGKIAQSFALPTPHGMFLGVRAMGNPPADVAVGIERLVITSAGAKESKDASAIEPLMPLWSLNTFISLEEMTDWQLKFREQMEALVDKHYNVLMVGHLCRIMSFNDEPDCFGLEKRFFGDADAAKDEFSAFVKSDLWLRAVRDPKDGPFAKHFVAQALLEKEEAESSQ